MIVSAKYTASVNVKVERGVSAEITNHEEGGLWLRLSVTGYNDEARIRADLKDVVTRLAVEVSA